MSDWMYNRLALIGSDRDVENVVDAITSRDDRGERKLDFDKFDPVPEILNHVTLGVRSFGDVEVSRWWGEKTPSWSIGDATARPLTEEEVAEYDASGAATRWHWCQDNWGVAVSACGWEEASHNVYRFCTLEEPPTRFFCKLSAAHPTVVFILSSVYNEDPPCPWLSFFFGGKLFGSRGFRGDDVLKAFRIVSSTEFSGDLSEDLKLFRYAFGGVDGP